MTPAKLNLAFRKQASPLLSSYVSDSKHLYITQDNTQTETRVIRESTASTRYLKLPLTSADPLDEALRQSGLLSDDLRLLLQQKSPLKPHSTVRRTLLQSETLPPSQMDGVPVATTRARFRYEPLLPGQPITEVSVTYAVGVKDNLPRQVVTERVGPDGKKATTTETLTGVRLLDTVDEALFAPPKDAQEMVAAPFVGRDIAFNAAPRAAVRPANVNAIGETTPANASRPASSAPMPAVASLPLPRLSAMPETGLVVEGGDGNALRARYALGDVSLLAPSGEAFHVFTLRNTGDKPVTLARLQASCGCLSAFVQGAGSSSGNGAGTTLAPGAEAKVKVAVKLLGLRPGPLAKSVLVFTAQQPAAPAAVLEVSANLRAPVQLSSPALDFGSVQAGEERSLPLTLTPDVTLPKEAIAALPPLQSLHPSLTLETLPPTTGDAPGVRRYSVRLKKDAPLGPLFTSLAFTPTSAQGNVPAGGGAPSPSSAWSGFGVVVTAQVLGDLFAQPGSVAFGLVPSGEAKAVRTVRLTAKDASLFSGLSLASDTPRLSTRLLPTEAGESGASRTLEVTLAPGGASGLVSGTLTLTLKDSGQRLLLPVTAFLPQQAQGAPPQPRPLPTPAPAPGGDNRP